MIITSEFPPVEVLDVPIHDAVLGRAQEYGDRRGDGRRRDR